MNSFYPRGALKGSKKLEALLAQRHKNPSVVYLVTGVRAKAGPVSIFRLPIKSSSTIEMYPKFNGEYPRWHIVNSIGEGTLTLTVNPATGYLGSTFSNGYVFTNFWRVYAYTLHLKQSGFTIDWAFPVAVG